MLRTVKNFDYTLMITPILLSGFGVIMVYSASMVTAVLEGLDSTYYLTKQFQWFSFGLILFFICSVIPYKKYQHLVKPIIFISIILLIAVLFYGKNVNHAVRSIVLFGGFSIQPAEFVKIGLIIYLASVYSKKQSYIHNFFTGVLPPLILMTLILSLIILQPDIGTSVIILLIAGSIILSAGIRFRHLLLLLSISVTGILLLIPYLATEKRLARITGAYQPFDSPGDGGHHLIHSYLAIGNGGLTGEGLGQSVQKLGFLWGAHTDFIMSVIAEELGFIGVFIVIGLLATIVLRGIYIARKCPDNFGTFLAIGISSMIGIQAFINLGAISGILPITGVPLPFLSYGGSSLLVLMISMGILNNIARTVKENERRQVREDQSVVNDDFYLVPDKSVK